MKPKPPREVRHPDQSTPDKSPKQSSHSSAKSAEFSFSKDGKHTQHGYPIRLFWAWCPCPNILCSPHPQQGIAVKLETGSSAGLFMCVYLLMMADWAGTVFLSKQGR